MHESYSSTMYKGLSGNKMKNDKCFLAMSLNTYSPIHLFTFSPVCLEIKRKTENILLLRVKTTIHLFTYSPFPFILPFDNFRLVEPKRRCSHHILQNWAYATKRRLASLLLHFWHDSYSETMQYGVSGNQMKNGQLFFGRS